jgi:hypothetical protein
VALHKKQLQSSNERYTSQLYSESQKHTGRIEKLEADNKRFIGQLKESEEVTKKATRDYQTAVVLLNQSDAIKATNDDNIASQEAKIQKKKEIIKGVRDTCAELETQIATTNGHVTRLEKELASASKKFGEHEGKIRMTELEVTQLKEQLKRHDGAKQTESVRIRQFEAAIELKDTEITRITAESASLHITLRRKDSQIKKEQDNVAAISNMKQNVERELATSKRELQRVQHARSRPHTPPRFEDSEGRQASGCRHTMHRLYGDDGGTRPSVATQEVRHVARSIHTGRRSEQESGGEDGRSQSSHQSDGSHDSDGQGGLETLYFVHLLARLRALVGPGVKERNDLVNALVNVFLDHITDPRVQTSIMTMIMTLHTESSESMSFGQVLYDYLLQHDTTTSLQSRLAQLQSEAYV